MHAELAGIIGDAWEPSPFRVRVSWRSVQHGTESETESEMPQEKSENHALFSERTESLARKLACNLDDLPEGVIGMSKDMFYAYRSGRHRISNKAWHKLEAAELKYGIRYPETPEHYRVIEEAPAAVQDAIFQPGLAWDHYLEAESLLDHLLAERAGKPLTDEDRRNFGVTLRHFMAHRDRGRKALLDATRIADDIGTRVLGHWMAATGQVGGSAPDPGLYTIERDLRRAQAKLNPGRKHRSA